MPAKYLLLNSLFLIPLIMLVIIRRAHIQAALVLRTFVVLCLLTAIFDNLLIAAGIVAYDPANLTGLKIGLAPIEDFAYTLAAVLLVALWWGRGRQQDKEPQL